MSVNETTKVLVVDDDESLCQLFPLYFKKEGFDTTIVSNGKLALQALEQQNFDIILLDSMMPEMDGPETLANIRRSGKTVPVIMVTARNDVVDRIGGLELGADDYVTKPFEMQELISRMRAILRRANAAPAQGGKPEVVNPDITIGNLFVSINNYIVKVCGKSIDMAPKELELLYYFASNKNHVFTRKQLIENLWKESYDGDTRTVDVHIKRIRSKLGANANVRIGTVWRKGYKLETE
ncbi:MAG: response regulator transcription factor [Firmicutes bacterium]|nr:response regulator transcription factor [Bacillota bacterium]